MDFWVHIFMILGAATLLGVVGTAIYMAVRHRPTADGRAAAMRQAYTMPAVPPAAGNVVMRGGAFSGSDGRTIAWQSYEPVPAPAQQPEQPTAPAQQPAAPVTINVTGQTVTCGQGQPQVQPAPAAEEAGEAAEGADVVRPQPTVQGAPTTTGNGGGDH